MEVKAALALVSLITLPLAATYEKGIDVSSSTNEVAITLDLEEAKVAVEGGGKKTISFSTTGEAKPIITHEGRESDELLYIADRSAGSDWQVKLGNKVPTDLAINLPKGRLDLSLDTTMVRDLFVDAGNALIAVKGEGKFLEDVEISQNQGLISLKLTGKAPKLRAVDVEGGQGLMRLELEGNYPSLSKVSVEGGAGDIESTLTGRFDTLTEALFKGTSGNLKLDLSGRWGEIAKLEVETTRGNVSVILPDDVGVEVRASSAAGKVSVKGLSKTGTSYVNSAYGKSPVTLMLEVKTLSGNIDLVVDRQSNQ